MGWPVMSISYSSSLDGMLSRIASTSSRQPPGRSAATPPGRMKLWFMRRPVTFWKKRSTSSRSRQPYSIIDTAPRSMPLVARYSRWLLMRFSSDNSMRIHTARSGTSPSIPSSFSTASEKTSSLFNGER